MRIAVKFAEGTLEENLQKVRAELPEAVVALENHKRNMVALTLEGDMESVRAAIERACPVLRIWDETVPQYGPDVGGGEKEGEAA